MEQWKSNNPAVALVNARLTNAGHDMESEAANPAWYGLHRQRAEQLAFALLPVKHHRDAPRLMAEHLHWLGRAPSRWRNDGWHWRYDTHERLTRALCCPAVDTIKKATADLKKAGLMDSRKAFMPGTTTAVTHYRLTDAAHVVLGLLSLAGMADLTDAEWLELLAPTDANAKPLRDVLAGWQDVNSPEALNAMQQAIKAAVDRVQPEGAKAMPRTLYEAWRKSVKADYPDPGVFTVTQRKRVAAILKELKQQAAEPGAAFKYTPEALAHLARQVATRWDEFVAMVKEAKGKKLPPVPDLDALSWHIPVAVRLAFEAEAEAMGKAKMAGW